MQEPCSSPVPSVPQPCCAARLARARPRCTPVTPPPPCLQASAAGSATAAHLDAQLLQACQRLGLISHHGALQRCQLRPRLVQLLAHLRTRGAGTHGRLGGPGQHVLASAGRGLGPAGTVEASDCRRLSRPAAPPAPGPHLLLDVGQRLADALHLHARQLLHQRPDAAPVLGQAPQLRVALEEGRLVGAHRRQGRALRQLLGGAVAHLHGMRGGGRRRSRRADRQAGKARVQSGGWPAGWPAAHCWAEHRHGAHAARCLPPVTWGAHAPAALPHARAGLTGMKPSLSFNALLPPVRRSSISCPCSVRSILVTTHW